MVRVRELSVTAASPHTAFSSSSFAISFWGLRNRIQEHAKCLRFDRQHLASLDERELPLANLHVSESENNGLIAIIPSQVHSSAL